MYCTTGIDMSKSYAAWVLLLSLDIIIMLSKSMHRVLKYGKWNKHHRFLSKFGKQKLRCAAMTHENEPHM